jgi:signal transduction histidine kinase
MLSKFVTVHSDAIVAAANAKSDDQQRPPASSEVLGVFLSQLVKVLRRDSTQTLLSSDVVGSSSGHQRNELLAELDIAEVVHHYADIREAIVELVVDQHAAISFQELRILNGFVDTAIARAVTEHARLASQKSSTEETERLGQAAHELRNMLHTAALAYRTMKLDSPINGNAGTILGRSLLGLQIVIDRTVAEVRLAAGSDRREQVALWELLEEIAVVAKLHAEYKEMRFVVDQVDPALTVNVDAQLLTSAVMNLVNNAFECTRAGGQVVLRAYSEDDVVYIEVEDQCGGIPATKQDPFQAFGDRRGRDRTGLGLGLSIARKAVKAHGGDIEILNMPGKGCIFIIELPLAAAGSAVTHPTVQ